MSSCRATNEKRIVRLANRASDVRKLGTALSGIAVASLIAQRDEARGIVRGAVDVITAPQMAAHLKAAIARWDEEGEM